MTGKAILQSILALLTRATIRRYQPMIIGVTGSVGKTSTREAIARVLGKTHRVRTAEKNYNNEIGLPLTVLGIPHYGRNILGWARGFAKAPFLLLRSRSFYPEVLVLEYGVDRPRDMEYLLTLAAPHIAVVTAIGEIPVHVEFFKDPHELAQEKAKLVQAVPSTGCVVLNQDDGLVRAMEKEASASVMTFGFEESAQIRITNYRMVARRDDADQEVPDGTVFKLEYQGSVVPVRFSRAFGRGSAYAAAAAAAVGVSQGMNLVEIIEALGNGEVPAGRLRLLEGIRGSWILDDSYNAAPESMRVALSTLQELPGKRKVAILGDMLELGHYSESAHRTVAEKLVPWLDFLVTVGERARWIAEEAWRLGMERTHIFSFTNSDAATEAIIRSSVLQAGNGILVKGSQGMRMERVVETIMAHPERAAELLIRQEAHWKKQEG